MTASNALERIAKALETQRTRAVMNSAEAADYLGVSESFLNELKTSYTVPFCRIGGRVVYRQKDLEKYLETVTVTSPNDDPGRKRHVRKNG